MAPTEQFRSLGTELTPEKLQTLGNVYCDFQWQAQPTGEWCNLSREALTFIANSAARFYRVTPKDQKRIFVHFGDHTPSNDGKLHLGSNVGTYINGAISEANVFINRSLELMQINCAKLNRHFLFNQNNDYLIKDYIIWHTLKNPLEFALSVIGEEMNHAAVSFRMKTSITKLIARQSYFQKIKNIHPGIKETNYSGNLMEVIASRERLKFMEYMALIFGYPDRADYFSTIHQLSLEKKLAAAENPFPIINQIFVPTGYQP